jgi:hypothetical protein
MRKAFSCPACEAPAPDPKDIAGFNIQTYCSSEHIANLITLPQRITDIGTLAPLHSITSSARNRNDPASARAANEPSSPHSR